MFMESPNLLEQSQHEPFDNRLVRSAGEVAAARRVDVFRTVDNRRSERAVVRRRRSLPIFIHLDDEARRVELGLSPSDALDLCRGEEVVDASRGREPPDGDDDGAA